jgi:hypothetical protein
MIGFSTRDILWLAVVIALSIGWWIDADPDEGLREKYRAACVSARDAWHRTEFLTKFLVREGHTTNGMQNYSVFENYGNPVPEFE